MTWLSAVLALSPLAGWRLGESSGTTAADSSGNGHDGTIISTVTLGAGGLIPTDITATSFDFSGAGTESVSVANAAWMNLTNQDFSILFWVRLDTMPGVGAVCAPVGRRIGGAADSSLQSWGTIIRADGSVQFVVHPTNSSSSSSSSAAGAITVNTTHMVTCTFDITGANSTLKTYVDGVQTSTDTIGTNTLIPGTRALVIGKNVTNADRHVNGREQDVWFFGTALTPAQITTLYGESTTTTATGDIQLGGSAAGAGDISATGSLLLGASASAAVGGSAAGSILLGGSGTATIPPDYPAPDIDCCTPPMSRSRAA